MSSRRPTTSCRRSAEDDHAFLHEMAEDYNAVTRRRVREVYHDATFAKERSQELFNSGVLTLRDRALAEQIYIATITAVARHRAAGHARSTKTSSRISRRRSLTAISATSRFSSRYRIAGRSISSSR